MDSRQLLRIQPTPVAFLTATLATDRSTKKAAFGLTVGLPDRHGANCKVVWPGRNVSTCVLAV